MFITRDYQPDEADHAIPILTPKRRALTKAAERLIYYYSLAYRDAMPSYSNNGRMGVGIRAGALAMRLRELALANGVMPTGIIDVPASPFGTEAYSFDISDLLQRGAERRELITRNDAAGALAREAAAVQS